MEICLYAARSLRFSKATYHEKEIQGAAIGNAEQGFVSDAHMVYIYTKTKYYGKTEYIVHETK